MKKAIFKSLLVVVISIGLVNYLVYLQTGKMLRKNSVVNFASSLHMRRLSDFSFFNFLQEKMMDSFESVGPKISSNSQTPIYKWTDERGMVHYSEELPMNSRAQKISLMRIPTLLKEGRQRNSHQLRICQGETRGD